MEKRISSLDEFINENMNKPFKVPKEGDIIKLKIEYNLDRWGTFISAGTYVVGKEYNDEEYGPSVKLFNKSKQRFTKAGTSHTMSLQKLEQGFKTGTIVNVK